MPELSLLKYFRRHAPRHPWLSVGPGQDCAVLRWPANQPVVFKIDQLVEGVHFCSSGPQAATPRQIGWKAVAKTFSDAAAAGCMPIAIEVSLALPADHSEKFIKEIYAGLTACCRKFGAALAGGDLSASPAGVALSTAMLAVVPQSGRPPKGIKTNENALSPWLRRGGRPGDVLFVTGSLGGSLTGKHLRFMPRINEASILREILGSAIHACIDVTDGLSRDLRHLCRESGCGAEIELVRLPISRAAQRSAAYAPLLTDMRDGGRTRAKKTLFPVPLLRALGDGEDFELLFAVAPEAAQRLERDWRHKTPVTRIGKLTVSRTGCSLLLPEGKTTNLPDIGYEHLRKKKA